MLGSGTEGGQCHSEFHGSAVESRTGVARSTPCHEAEGLREY